VSLYNLQEVQDTLKILFEPGDVVELRALHTSRNGTISGYFADMDKLPTQQSNGDGSITSIRLNLSIDWK